jgi:hypothetical protein
MSNTPQQSEQPPLDDAVRWIADALRRLADDPPIDDGEVAKQAVVLRGIAAVADSLVKCFTQCELLWEAQEKLVETLRRSNSVFFLIMLAALRRR